MALGGDRGVFRKIFQVNNEIGKAARRHPKLRQGLLDLQSNVNVITVSLKAGDESRAREAIRASLLSFGKIGEGRPAPKKKNL